MYRLLAVTGLMLLCGTLARAGTIRVRNWEPASDVLPDVIAGLAQQTTDPDPEVRVRALEQLGHWRLQARDTLDAVVGCLRDETVVETQAGRMTVARLACATLGLLGEPNAVPHLIPLLDDPDLRDIACKALYLVRDPGAAWNLKAKDVLTKEDLLDPQFGCDPLNWTAWWTRRNLPGREVVVRVYKDPLQDPARFELVKAKVVGHSIPLEAILHAATSGTDPCSIVLVCPQDQQDDDLRIMMGRSLSVRSVSEGKSLSTPDRFWQVLGGHTVPERWTFEDALGSTIANVSVEVWLWRRKTAEDCRILLGRWNAPDGTVEAIQVSGAFGLAFVVSHPEYGTARVAAILSEQGHVRVPLVRLGSEAGKRAVWGTVVDESGQAIPGACIRCRTIRTLGEGLLTLGPEGGTGEVLADDNGFFALYMSPSDHFAHQRGVLIPPGSRYDLSVRPPAGSDLLPFQGYVPNGEAAQIVLRCLHRKARRFVFQMGDEIVQDPTFLEHIVIGVQPPGRPSLAYDYAQWSAGCMMPEGTYTATLEADGSKQVFGPVVVSRDSPDVIVFAARPVAYSGRVVDARTGRPVAGAFVLAETSRRGGKFSNFTDAQWDRLEQLEAHPSTDDEALKPVRRVYEFLDIVRTDAAGQYEIRSASGTLFYGLVCFARDCIPVQYRTTGLFADASGGVQIPCIPLYPAASVAMYVQADAERVSIAAEWRFDEKQVPAWAKPLCSLPGDRRLRLIYACWYTPNAPQRVYVPADVPLQLAVRPSPEHYLCPWTYPQSICLSQGATMDLGPCTLPKAVTVALTVEDREGIPVEGVPVRCVIGRPLHGSYNTDESGQAVFHVPPHSSGELGVSPGILFRRRAHSFRAETVAFEAGGAEDQTRQFTLVLSDELRAFLFDGR